MTFTKFIPVRLSIFKTALTQLRKNWVYSVAEKITIICLIVSTGILFWRWQLLPPEVPLWYSRFWGSDRLTSPVFLIFLVVSMFVWHVVNMIMAFTFLKHYRVFIQAMFVTSTFVSIMILVTVTEIVFLVT